MNASWMIPFIILGGALQTCGAAMNGQLNKSLVNPWLASPASFAVITFFFTALFLMLPHQYFDHTRRDGTAQQLHVAGKRPRTRKRE